MSTLPALFARTNTGKIQQWTVEFEGNRYRTSYGQTDGAIQTTNWTVCQPTNEGRANQRTSEQQAEFEANALWKKKKDSGYYESIKDVDVQAFVEPMLAKKFEDYQEQLTFPIYSQAKLDGLRCIAKKDGLFSRNGKRYYSVPHIEETLKPLFDANPTLILDGELYCDKFANDFNAICSLVKKTKPSASDIEASSAAIEYHVYDIVDTEHVFSERNSRYKEIITSLRSNVSKCPIVEVETTEINTKDQLDELYTQYLEKGYEGQMVRFNKKYETKRSKYLLKRKEFQDKEYVVLDIIEGEGNKQGVAGAMVFESERGIKFNSNIKGNREFLRDIWENKQEYIGKLATVKFFNLTPDNNLPRFPYVTSFRESFDM